MRKKGSSNKTLKWHVKIYHDFGKEIVLLDQQYHTMKDVAQDLNLSYNQMWELTKRGRVKRDKCRYMPKIQISKL